MTALTLTDPDLFRQAALIGGEWVEADGGGTFAVTNPATGETIGHVPNLGAAETERAIAAAAAAFPAWSRLTAAERAVPLRRLFELMLAHIDDLAAINGLRRQRGAERRIFWDHHRSHGFDLFLREQAPRRRAASVGDDQRLVVPTHQGI